MTDTLVTGAIRQRNDAPAPTHYPDRGAGGWRSAIDTDARDAIPAWLREAGMAVMVLTAAVGPAGMYTLDQDLTTWHAVSGATVAQGTGISVTGGPNYTVAVDSTIATKSYADGAASAAVTTAESYTDTALAGYATTGSVAAAIVTAEAYTDTALAAYLTTAAASSTYATRASLTGTGYMVGAGSFPPSFVASIPVGDLSGVSSWSPTIAALTVTGALGAGATTLASLIVSGDLTVQGTHTIVDSTSVQVKDRVIQVNRTTGTAPVPTNIAGVSVLRGNTGSADRDPYGVFWDEANSTWVFAVNTGGDDATLGADLALRVGSLRVSSLGTGIGHYSSTGVLTSSLLVDADVSASAAIAVTKLSTTGASTGYGIRYSGSAWAVAQFGFSDLSGSATLAQLPTGTGFLVGSGGAPTFRAFALSDIPNGTGYLKGSGSAPAYTATIARADLANASGAVGDLWYWDGSNMVRLAAVASGSVLASAGVTTAPTWSSSVSLTGLTLTGLTASNYVVTNGSKVLTSQSGVPIGDLTSASGATGDLLIGSSTSLVRLAKGSTGQALISGASTLAWGTDFGANDLTTTGNILLGATPRAAGGRIRLAQGDNQTIAFRNAANTGDICALSANADYLSIGTDLASGGVPAGIILNATSQLLFRISGSNELVVNSTTLQSNVSVLVTPTGGTPATAGDIRFQNNRTHLAFRNNANGADVAALATDTSNNLTIGDATNGARLKLTGATAVQIAMSTPVFEIGTGTVASAGSIRATQGATQFLAFRNNANSADVSVLAATADVIYIGVNLSSVGQASQVIINGVAGATIRVNGSNTFAVAAATSMLTSTLALGSATNTATIGDLKLATTRTHVAIRNAANTDDIVALATDSSNNIWIGSSVAGAARSASTFVDCGTAVELRVAGTTKLKVNSTGFALFGVTPVGQQTSGANLTNNVTVGGTTDQVDTWTDLVTYATDAVAIRNAIYQLARKLKQLNDGLRAFGAFT